MHRTALALAGLLLLIPFADSPAAQPAAPSWYRNPPAQKGYVLAKATAESKLAALLDAIVGLALERAARRSPAPAAGEASLVSFGAIDVQTTKTIIPDAKAGKVEKTQARIEMKTERGAATILWTRELPIAKGKKRQTAKRVFDADLVKTSANDLVAELKRAGVAVRTSSIRERHYALLKQRIPPGERGAGQRR
jgi:hypothetical protein